MPYGPSLRQVGQIPSDAKSLVFYFRGSNIAVSFSGHPLQLNILQHRDSYYVMGADISMFAGQEGELRFTAGTDEVRTGGGTIDEIRFTRAVGEPKLFIEHAAEGLKILWPLWATDFDLESCEGNFTPWAKVGDRSVPEGLFSTLLVHAPKTASYYRLRRR
jgi:hypothetical protein